MIRHKKKLLVGLAALLVGGSIMAPGSSQAGSTPSTPKYYTATSSGARMYGGVQLAETITLKNTTVTTGDIDLGAAKVVVPAGLNVTGTPTAAWYSSTGVLKPWNSGYALTYTAATRTILVSGMDVDPGQWVTITVNVDSCTAGTYTWTSDARQSNQFNGQDNKLNLQGSAPVSTIAAGDACRLAFTTNGQPKDTFPTAIITNTAYAGTPSTPIAVAAVNGKGAPLTGWSTPIVLGVTGGDATATLTGGGSATPASGVATWAPSLNKASTTPYQLTASSTGLASATSNAFFVRYRAEVDCLVDGPTCQSPTVPGPGGGSAQVTVNGGTVDGKLTVDFDNSEIPECPDYTEIGTTAHFDLAATSSLTFLYKTITLVQVIPAGATYKNTPSQNQICYRAPYQFPGFQIADLLTVFGGDTVVVNQAPVAPDNAARWQGLLYSCNYVGPSDPCIVSRTVTVAATAGSPGSVTIVLRVPPADPWAR